MTEFQDTPEAPDLDRVRQVLTETRGKLESLHRQRTEPIALLGAGCRLPGGVRSPEQFWELLRDGTDAMREVPAERWDVDEFYDPEPGTPGKMYVREGGYLDELGGLDPEFFPPIPELLCDPRQRMMLEVVWEALERSALPPDRLPKTTTGVYLSLGPEEYEGSPGGCFAAGRISNFLGLEGPTLHLDTACSSTLVGLHLASQALRSGEIEVAIVGGISLVLSPANPIQRCACCMFAPDARCRAFDAEAQGSAQGEGCVALILKRESDALNSGNPVMALLKGSAINHDGASSCLGVPSKRAQVALLSRTLKNASLHPKEVSYIEAHASGSAISDALELEALAEVFGGEREQALLLGSAKSNFGNLEAAAGAAAVLKVALSLEKKALPPHLHFQQPSPYFRWSDHPLEVNAQLSNWSRSEGSPLRAGVSTFSVTGSNAHLVLEEAPTPRTDDDSPFENHLFVLSARSQESLRELVSRYSSWLESHPEASLAQLCFTTQVGRTHHPYRLAKIVRTRTELLSFLAQPLPGEFATQEPSIGLAFRGQFERLDWVEALTHSAPSFGQALDQAPALRDRLLAGECDKQGALLLSWAVSQLFRAMGLNPAFVVGQSGSEEAAGVAAGVLDLDQALALCSASGQADRQELAQGLRLRTPLLPVSMGSRPNRVDEVVTSNSFWAESPQAQTASLDSPHLTLGGDFELWESLAQLYLAGVPLNFAALYREGGQKLVLPTYPFHHKVGEAEESRSEFVEPSTSLQKLVAGLWEDLLECERVGLFDSFFGLGGSSLLAAEMIRRLQDYLECPLSLSLILECVTLEGFSSRLLELHGPNHDLEKIAQVWLHVQSLSEEETQRELDSLD